MNRRSYNLYGTQKQYQCRTDDEKKKENFIGKEDFNWFQIFE